jgi:hypothetical protein
MDSKRPRTVSPLGNLFAAVRKAHTMLSLPDDWDDAGSPSIRPETLRRAVFFLLLNSAIVLWRYAAVVPTPRITPGPDGSVDLHWRTRRRELLINVPRESQEPFSYYGDDFGSDKRKGSIPADSLAPDLFAWLTIAD